jgi:hypothetical protein
LHATGITKELDDFTLLLDSVFFSEELEINLNDEELRDALDLFGSFAEDELFCSSAPLDSVSGPEMTEEEDSSSSFGATLLLLSSAHAIKNSTAKTNPIFLIFYPSNFQPQSLW